MAVETKEVLEDVRAGKLQPWWCLDTYLCAHLAELLTKLRDEGKSHSMRFDNHEQWQAWLTRLIEPLVAYDADDAPAYKAAQEALITIANNLGDFWD